MAITATRAIAYTFTGDVVASKTETAANNATSPGEIEKVPLTTGANTITPPASPFFPKAVTIIMPSGNTVLVTLKGVSGDTGVPLHKTDPTSIGLDSTTTTFVLNAASGVTVTMVWH
jgi:hypothetical protein